MSFYAVKSGLVPGIYTNWNDCKKQVDGFKGARYKKFATRDEALNFIGEGGTCQQAVSNISKNLKTSNIGTTTVITKTTTTTVTKIVQSTLGKSSPVTAKLVKNSLSKSSPLKRKTSTESSLNENKAKKNDLSNYYLCSNNAEKNFYLDPRHSNNISSNENEEPVYKYEPKSKKIKVEPEIKIKPEPVCKYETEVKIKQEAEQFACFNVKREAIEKLPDKDAIDNLLKKAVAKSRLLEYELNVGCDFSFSGKHVCVYTDGACSGNGQANSAAGIGIFWGPSHPLNVGKKLSGLQTNNRAEITAAIIAISQAILYEASELTINTDSQFMINCMQNWITKWKSNGWMTASKQPVKNVEDMKRLDELCEFIKINWEYCPGHKGVYGNEEADKLATGAVVKYVKK